MKQTLPVHIVNRPATHQKNVDTIPTLPTDHKKLNNTRSPATIMRAPQGAHLHKIQHHQN